LKCLWQPLSQFGYLQEEIHLVASLQPLAQPPEPVPLLVRQGRAHLCGSESSSQGRDMKLVPPDLPQQPTTKGRRES